MLRPFLFGLMTLLTLSFLATSAYSQVTNATLRGTIVDDQGNPVEGATVEIKQDAGQVSKSTQTNDSGSFAFIGLKVGGPYTLTAVKAGMTQGVERNINLKAGNNPAMYLQVFPQTTGSDNLEVIQVTGSRVNASGRGTNFDVNDIQTAPSTSGDLRDIIRGSPDVYVEGNSISIGGANNRFNSITIDGIRQDDDFGLNASGFPTARTPIALQSIEEVTVNKTPFDVRYGNFLGGNVNVVTKSGTNELQASAYAAHLNDNWVGKKSKDLDVPTDFQETRVGATVGGAIVEDELFYFFSAEGLESRRPNPFGVAGSGAPFESSDIFAEDVARVQEITRRVYNFEPGTIGRERVEEDLKLLAKFDWELSPFQKLEAKLQHNKGSDIIVGFANDDQLPLTSNGFKVENTINTASLRLFSDWNDSFSTKLEASFKHVETRQNPLEGNGFMEAVVTTANGSEISVGPDRFRHANRLDNDVFHLGAEGNYLLGDHFITAGIQWDDTQIINLFGDSSNGLATYGSIENYENLFADEIVYSNAITNNVLDLEADWGFQNTVLFAQDEWQISNTLTATFGLRFENYQSNGNITLNPNFLERYGFANTEDLDGKQAFLPRLGLTYRPTKRLTLNTGFGIYGGGTPNVWISNNYTNDGFTQNTAIVEDYNGFDGRNIPQDIQSQIAAANSNVNALDPGFELPQSYKFALDTKYSFDVPGFLDNINFDFSYSYSQAKHALNWIDLRRGHSSIENNSAVAVGPDGREIFDLTPSDRQGYDSARPYDLLLTNTDKGFAHNASFTLSKAFDFGLFISGSYAWQDVEEVNAGNSSRAVSNYGQVAVGRDPNDPDLATSNYERKHRFLINATYQKNFISNLVTSFSMFFERRSGQPYSYTFGGRRETLAALFGGTNEYSRREQNLFYVPKGDGSDVIYGEGIDEASMNAFLAKTGLDDYRGEIAPRNVFFGDWVDNIDFQLSQELPGIKENHRARITFDIQNLPNLLNKEWGQVRNPRFPFFVQVADVDYDAASGRYVYSNLADRPENETIDNIQSIWQMQLMLTYQF